MGTWCPWVTLGGHVAVPEHLTLCACTAWSSAFFFRTWPLSENGHGLGMETSNPQWAEPMACLGWGAALTATLVCGSHHRVHHKRTIRWGNNHATSCCGDMVLWPSLDIHYTLDCQSTDNHHRCSAVCPSFPPASWRADLPIRTQYSTFVIEYWTSCRPASRFYLYAKIYWNDTGWKGYHDLGVQRQEQCVNIFTDVHGRDDRTGVDLTAFDPAGTCAHSQPLYHVLSFFLTSISEAQWSTPGRLAHLVCRWEFMMLLQYVKHNKVHVLYLHTPEHSVPFEDTVHEINKLWVFFMSCFDVVCVYPIYLQWDIWSEQLHRLGSMWGLSCLCVPMIWYIICCGSCWNLQNKQLCATKDLPSVSCPRNHLCFVDHYF